MTQLTSQLEQCISQAIHQCFGEKAHNTHPCLSQAKNPKFGDYQANFAMQLAKSLGQNPRQIAEQVITAIGEPDFIEAISVAGPGFINITLTNKAIEDEVILQQQQPLFNLPTSHKETIVVDYGGANVAKEMHVGHLRSAVIGDAITRLLTYLGHNVIRQNHLGDWGTQFGMLIEYMTDQSLTIDKNTPISTLNIWYKAAKQQFDNDTDFAKRAKGRVVKLQQGDTDTLSLWQQLVAQSEISFDTLYQRLDLLLQPSDNCGESFYNDQLASIVTELRNNNIATESEQAIVIFLPGFTDRDNLPLPMIIQKSDGGYLYATTDLAAAKYRLKQLNAQRLIYVTDARQKQHFSMLFAALKAANWADSSITLNHIAFGSVLGEDKKPFKTRSGESIRLASLLDEAEARVLNILNERQSDSDPSTLQQTAKDIGIGAIKYADLSTERQKDYVFNWDHMLAFTGNTGPYLQNALVRIHAIFRKGNMTHLTTQPKAITLNLTTSEERSLALQLTLFPDLLKSIETDLAINRLCQYLFNLAAEFHHFYEHCSVLNANTDTSKATRLNLCRFTANILTTGLSLLGITPLEKM